MKTATTTMLLCAVAVTLLSHSGRAQQASAMNERSAANSVVLAFVDRLSDPTAQAEIVRYHRGHQRNIILLTRSGASPESIARALGTIMIARSHDKETASGPLGVYSRNDPRLVQRILQRGTSDSKGLTSEMRAAAAAYLSRLRSAPLAPVVQVGNVPAITIKLASESP